MQIVVNPKYDFLRKFVEELPSKFDESGEQIFGGRNVIKIMDINGLCINVKSFKKPNIINRFVYGNFRKSKARRSFEYANMLIDKDINTPDPIAYIEERKGIEFSGSFYISVHEQFDGTMRELKFVKMEGQENLMKQFAVFTASMHEKEVLHLDYSPGNILYKKQDDEYSFYLVDLNRMYFGKVPMKEGCKSLRRLWGSDEMIAYIAAEYAKARGFDVGKTVELAMHYHRKFWQEFTRKHPDRQAYIGEVR